MRKKSEKTRRTVWHEMPVELQMNTHVKYGEKDEESV